MTTNEHVTKIEQATQKKSFLKNLGTWDPGSWNLNPAGPSASRVVRFTFELLKKIDRIWSTVKNIQDSFKKILIYLKISPSIAQTHFL